MDVMDVIVRIKVRVNGIKLGEIDPEVIANTLAECGTKGLSKGRNPEIIGLSSQIIIDKKYI